MGWRWAGTGQAGSAAGDDAQDLTDHQADDDGDGQQGELEQAGSPPLAGWGQKRAGRHSHSHTGQPAARSHAGHGP